ncbi:hypothetical protein DOTSEDRAFT_34092 [Dothistroma septosporum NZE10]|uniref:Ecp2 effector protein domain-containing protein n=1 Tax=Dothistroma septosporum (strain NZE10 / CBS 128990) TaxID=675120 RepID=N1PQB0_DOTSN|nr:hypothetical protein DOTSEDRAFT_34092 [Dothistroma septosporum NZE10]
MSIKLISFAFLTLSTRPGAMSSPLKQAVIAPNTAICDFSLCSQGHGASMGCYNIRIGRPFIQGGGCPSIQQNLRNGITYLANYHCQDDGSGQTSLSFNTPADPASNIGAIEALQKSYPDVPFESERICLMDGNTVPASWPPEITCPIEPLDSAADVSATASGTACGAGEGVENGCDN